MILLRHGQSLFNALFTASRVDPGIVDPELTEAGLEEAAAAAQALRDLGLRSILASPYRRTLQTAAVVADALDLPVTVEALVRERAFFTCDVGTRRSELIRQWPAFDFADLPEVWWPDPEETEEELSRRCARFRQQAAGLAERHQVLVVSHWAFIRGLTGVELPNAGMLRFDPHAGGGGAPAAVEDPDEVC